jgi:hypothetical protein
VDFTLSFRGRAQFIRRLQLNSISGSLSDSTRPSAARNTAMVVVMKTSAMMRLLMVALTLSEMKSCALAVLKGKSSLCQPISQSVGDFCR